MNKKLIENQLNNNTVGYVGGLMDNQERQNVINVFLCKKKKKGLSSCSNLDSFECLSLPMWLREALMSKYVLGGRIMFRIFLILSI